MRDDVVDTTALPSLSGMAQLPTAVVAHRYRIGAPLGQGANANVYRALDLRLNRDVAIKLFHPGQDAAVRVRFAAEAQALARLSHPGLIGIFDAGMTDDDRPYLVMQLVDGESLRDRLLGGPLTSDEVVALGLRLAAALAHVHSHGVVHRDIKPSNIVLDGNGLPHLADFGIALLVDAARMTGSNEILGTAAYLSPEQILGDPVGEPADVYSLGLVLLECLTGQLEYPGVSKVESALARLHRPPRIPDGLPIALDELLTAMTARSAADRPTAAECASRLWAIQRGVDTTGRLRRVSRKMGFGWRRLAVAGSSLAIAIIASAWMLTSLPHRVPPVDPPGGASTGHFGTPAGQAPAAGTASTNHGVHVAAPVVAVDPGNQSQTTTVPTSAVSTDPGNTLAGTMQGPTPTTDPPTPTTTRSIAFGPNPGPSTSPTTTDPPTTTQRHHGHPHG